MQSMDMAIVVRLTAYVNDANEVEGAHVFDFANVHSENQLYFERKTINGEVCSDITTLQLAIALDEPVVFLGLERTSPEIQKELLSIMIGSSSEFYSIKVN